MHDLHSEVHNLRGVAFDKAEVNPSLPYNKQSNDNDLELDHSLEELLADELTT